MKQEDVLQGTRRVYTYRLRDVAKVLDEAYWNLETDKEVLESAERPLVNNPTEAKELIFQAIQKLEEMFVTENVCFETIDHLIYKISDVERRLSGLKLEVHAQYDPNR